MLQHLAQGQELRDAVHERQVDDAEGGLELRVLVEVVEDDLRDDVLLELDDEADALLVGLVAQVGDALEALLVDELGDLLLQGALVHLVGHLGEDEARAAGLVGLDVGLGADGERAAAGLVGAADAVEAHDDGARREVGTGHDGHELVGGGVGVVDEHAGGLDGLAEVVRRDVGRHADGDAVAAVHQQVREARGQHGGLGERLVVVGLPVDGVLLQVAEQLHGRLCQAALGVTHGGRGVAVDVAEVAVAVDQRRAHGEPLGEADHRLVDGRVTVRVVLTDDFADRPGTLLVRAVGEDAALVHRVEDAAMDRLQAVAHVGQGAGRDDRHRVFDEALAHLMAELGELQGPAVFVHLAGVGAATGVAELLLELAVVVGVILVVALDVDVGALVLGTGAVEQTAQVVRQVGGVLAVVLVDIVCHFWPFSQNPRFKKSQVLSLINQAQTLEIPAGRPGISGCRRLPRKRSAAC